MKAFSLWECINHFSGLTFCSLSSCKWCFAFPDCRTKMSFIIKLVVDKVAVALCFPSCFNRVFWSTSRELELWDDDIDGKFLWVCWLQLASRMVFVTLDLTKYSRLLLGTLMYSYTWAYAKLLKWKTPTEAVCDYVFILSGVQLCLSTQLASWNLNKEAFIISWVVTMHFQEHFETQFCWFNLGWNQWNIFQRKLRGQGFISHTFMSFGSSQPVNTPRHSLPKL